MEFKLKEMCDWERKKAVFLMSVAEDLGINLNDYGEVAVNPNSGNTYLWSEMFNFSLYMPINCELEKKDIYALWSCSECGEEIDRDLNNSDDLQSLEEWAEETAKEHNKDAHNKEE